MGALKRLPVGLSTALLLQGDFLAPSDVLGGEKGVWNSFMSVPSEKQRSGEQTEIGVTPRSGPSGPPFLPLRITGSTLKGWWEDELRWHR